MTNMIIIFLNSAGVIIVAIGLWATWRKNGREARERDERHARELAQRDTKLEMNQKNILKRLDDEKTGLSALHEAQIGIRNHCITVSTGVLSRLGVAENKIEDLERRRKK